MNSEMNTETTTEAPAPQAQKFYVVDLERANEKFAKLAKRAKKIGVEAPTFVVVESYPQWQWSRIELGEVIVGWVNAKGACEDYGHATGAMRTMNVCELRGLRTLCFNGWTFVATLDHELGEDNTIVRTVPGQELPADYRHRGQQCDHCRKSQVRKQTFVCRHEDGRMVQVGSTCVRDFLGHDAAQALAEVDLCSMTLDALEDEGGSGGFNVRAWDTQEYLAWVCMETRKHGWVSRGESRASGATATADRAFKNMLDYAKGMR